MATSERTRQPMEVAQDRNGLKAPFAALHHVAVVTNDMKKTVAFYRDVLGSEVAMGHRLDRPGNERHYFITVAPNTVFAFFEFPDAELPPYKPATLPSTGRSLDHICFHVEADAAFDRWYAHLGEQGVDNLSEIIDRGGSRSFFFSDPNNIVFEVATGNMGRPMPILEDPDPAY
jgi:catechol 2,3-dioxygenase-like lactoylglutathione lyase family enzyme